MFNSKLVRCMLFFYSRFVICCGDSYLQMELEDCEWWNGIYSEGCVLDNFVFIFLFIDIEQEEERYKVSLDVFE